mgnify:CR=1 FL=1
MYKGGVLAGKHFGRRNHRHLIARFYRHKNPRKRHGGFSASDVALQKPVHFLRGMKICENFFHGGFLPRGKPERKARNKAVKLGARYGIRVKARVVAPAFYYLESGNKQEILLQRYPFRALTAVLFALRSVNLYVCVFKRNARNACQGRVSQRLHSDVGGSYFRRNKPQRAQTVHKGALPSGRFFVYRHMVQSALRRAKAFQGSLSFLRQGSEQVRYGQLHGQPAVRKRGQKRLFKGFDSRLSACGRFDAGRRPRGYAASPFRSRYARHVKIVAREMPYKLLDSINIKFV